jgi:hypothetical protein
MRPLPPKSQWWKCPGLLNNYNPIFFTPEAKELILQNVYGANTTANDGTNTTAEDGTGITANDGTNTTEENGTNITEENDANDGSDDASSDDSSDDSDDDADTSAEDGALSFLAIKWDASVMALYPLACALVLLF